MSNEESGGSSEHTQVVMLFTILVTMVFYLSISGYLEHRKGKFNLLHETGIGIIIGALIGLIMYKADQNFYIKNLSFKTDVFFFYLLPPIIFSGGYNLQKRRFFQNIYYINLYGILSTLINFGITIGLTIAINELGLIRDSGNLETAFKLPLGQMMIFSATICATDSVAALAMIKPDKYPKLFSVLFGEGMVNDAVAIILFTAVQKIVGGEGDSAPSDFNAGKVFELLGFFLLVAFGSLAIGAVYGLLCTLFFKRFKFMCESASVESLVILLFGMCSYVTCELLKLSGVISVLVAGIVMAHYAYYNLSETGQVSSRAFLTSLATISEAFIYVYLGLVMWTYVLGDQSYAWSWTFTLLELTIAIIARTLSITLPSVLFRLIRGVDKWRLNRYETAIIVFAGIIRGSVSFALISKVALPAEEIAHTGMQIIQSSVLYIVIITTVLLGAVMPCFIKWNLARIRKNEATRYHKAHPSQRDTIGGEMEQSILNQLDAGEDLASRKYRSGTQKQWRKLEEEHIKPLLIRDYDSRKEEIKRQKMFARLQTQTFDKSVQVRRFVLSKIKEQIESIDRSIQDAIENQHAEDGNVPPEQHHDATGNEILPAERASGDSVLSTVQATKYNNNASAAHSTIAQHQLDNLNTSLNFGSVFKDEYEEYLQQEQQDQEQHYQPPGSQVMNRSRANESSGQRSIQLHEVRAQDALDVTQRPDGGAYNAY